ncbi:armadillo-type protein [Fimicolochytrium jonesii]|uniref:armadillo-type protein n=1 Tax=Fimicolochytrium jonesii TaxID=1396493 RepID=UPI0022FE94D4|nr:armadillo-type protein [Fimicolochytrium jonesii]KAI8822699.1 armadillo-type protein [Fimicolochytrium jonesii]
MSLDHSFQHLQSLLSTGAQDPTALIQTLSALAPQDDAARDDFAEHTALIDLLAGLLTDVTSGDVGVRTTIANVFAEAAKSESARDPIAEAGAIPALIAQLKLGHSTTSSDADNLVIQSLRALANLCYDHDINREKVLETPNGIAEIASYLTSPKIALLTTASGALTNISMDNEPVQVEILKAGVLNVLLQILTRHLDHPATDDNPDVIKMSIAAIRLISNLSESDRGVNELLATDGLSILLKLLRYKHNVILQPSVTSTHLQDALEALDALTTVLEAISENDAVQRAIVSRDLFENLLDFVDHRPTKPRAEFDEEAWQTYADVRKTVSRIATLVSMNDANMFDIPQKSNIMKQLTEWMAHGSGSHLSWAEEDEIRMSGALTIGNLARSDTTCVDLVERHGVVPPMLALLELETQRTKNAGAEMKGIIKVLHAVIGALKNLSLASANRARLGDLGVIQKISDTLEMPKCKPVHYLAVGVLKNLCAGSNDANVYRIVTGQEPPKDAASSSLVSWPATPAGQKTPLNKIINLIWNATGDNDTGIRNEGGRLLVNLVRAIHRAGPSPLLNTLIKARCIVPLIQIVTGALLTKARASEAESGPSNTEEEDDHHVHFDATPVEGQVFPMVQNEGVVALILLADASPDSITAISKYHASIVPTVVKILTSGLETGDGGAGGGVEAADPTTNPADPAYTYADESKTNVCVLLQALARTNDEFRDRLLAAGIKPVLDALRKQAPETASAPAQQERPLEPPPATTGALLGRSITKSARQLSDNAISKRELTTAFGTEEKAPGYVSGVALPGAAAALLMVL